MTQCITLPFQSFSLSLPPFIRLTHAFHLTPPLPPSIYLWWCFPHHHLLHPSVPGWPSIVFSFVDFTPAMFFLCFPYILISLRGFSLSLSPTVLSSAGIKAWNVSLFSRTWLSNDHIVSASDLPVGHRNKSDGQWWAPREMRKNWKCIKHFWVSLLQLAICSTNTFLWQHSIYLIWFRSLNSQKKKKHNFRFGEKPFGIWFGLITDFLNERTGCLSLSYTTCGSFLIGFIWN